MIKYYIKTAWRSLWRSKGAAWLNIAGLAVAMGAAILILLWVQNELRYDDYHPESGRIHLLTRYDTERPDFGHEETSPYPAGAAIRESVPGIALIATAQPSLYGQEVFEANGEQFHEKNALFVDSNWTKMFHYDVLEGSVGVFETTPYSILLTRSKARKYFGNQSAVGQTVYIDSIPHRIVGVIANIPANSSFQQDVLVSNTYLLKGSQHSSSLEYWGFYSQWLFAKLESAVSVDKVEAGITEVFRDNQPWSDRASLVSKLIALPDLHFMQGFNSEIIPKGNPQNIRIFSLLAGLLLVAASINFVNLSIARVGVRIKEIGIRKIVGAAKRHLFVQVLTETVLAVLLALGLALLFASIALPHFNLFTERQFTLDPGEGMLWLLLAGIFTFVLLLTGVYPALLLAALKPMGMLRNQGWSGMGRVGLQRLLVTAQLALAVLMIVGVLVIHHQFAFIQQQVAGYRKEQVFMVQAPPIKEVVRADDADAVGRMANSLQALKNDLVGSSTIVAVSKVNGVSMIDDGRVHPSEIRWGGYPDQENGPDMVNIWVDEDYLELAGLKLKSGRWFDPKNVSDVNNIVLNETAVEAFGLREPVIGTLYSGGIPTPSDGGMVIGVVEDFHHKNLREQIDPVVISIDPFMGHRYLVKAQVGQVSDALAHTEAIWKARYPGQPFEYMFLDEEFERLYKEDRRALAVSLVFGGLSILIACLGLLGMVIASTQQRVKEIGIRKVLGASVLDIVRMLSKDFVKLVCLAIVIASPIAWWAMNRWLEDFAYRIEIQWWMFALASAVALFVALATVATQAIRAAVANPVESLRDE